MVNENVGSDICGSSSSSGSKQSPASRSFAVVDHCGTYYCSCLYHHRGSSPSLGGESLSLSLPLDLSLPSPLSLSLSPSLSLYLLPFLPLSLDSSVVESTKS